jgi:hypothetical protein
MASVAPGGGKSFFGRMFARKSIAQVQRESATSELKRSLGKWNLLLLGVGCIIGAGIFVRTGSAAALYAGPAVLLSFVVAGIVCAFAGLCYAELSSTLPVSGSAYTYGYATLGEFVAWVMGALLLLEYGLAASVVAVGWGGYVVSLLADFGLQIPPQLTGPAGYPLMKDGVQVIADGQPVTTLFNLPAFLICLALAGLLVIGVSESAKVNNVIVAIKVSVLVAFIVVGGLIVLANFGDLSARNWSPFIPPSEGEGKFGVDGIMRAGFDRLLRLYRFRGRLDRRSGGQGPQARHAVRDHRLARRVHRHLHAGGGDHDAARALQPAQRARSRCGGGRQFRLYLGLARQDHQDRRDHRPHLRGSGADVCANPDLLHDGPRRPLAEDLLEGAPHPKNPLHQHHPGRDDYGGGGGLLRHQRSRRHDLGRHARRVRDRLPVGHLPAPVRPELPRGFKVPLYPVLPVLGILSCLYLITTVPWDVLKFFLWYMAGGIILYFVYGMRNSNLQHGDPQDDQPDLPAYPEDAPTVGGEPIVRP